MWGLKGVVREMVFFAVLYLVVLAGTWGAWRRHSKSKTLNKMKRKLLWSPILRCLMMTWFGTVMWTLTYFHGSVGGFTEDESMAPASDPQATRRMLGQPDTHRALVGLDETYNAYPNTGFFGILLGLFHCMILLAFPIISYNFLNYYFVNLKVEEFRIKYGTLYTDMWIRKRTAADFVALLCLRRFTLAVTTVFLNDYLMPSQFVYFYGSIFLLWYYIFLHPFDRKWIHYLELVNESFVVVVANFSFLFTEFVANIEVRYQFGAFLVDMLVWVVVINLIGIVYQFYLSSAWYYKKHRYESKWRAHLELKEELSLLVIEYEKYDEKDRIGEKHKLMLWGVQDLQARLDELRKIYELEQKEKEKEAEAAAQETEEPVDKRKSSTFAAFMDNDEEVV